MDWANVRLKNGLSPFDPDLKVGAIDILPRWGKGTRFALRPPLFALRSSLFDLRYPLNLRKSAKSVSSVF
jgi:hypothetical protein